MFGLSAGGRHPSVAPLRWLENFGVLLPEVDGVTIAIGWSETLVEVILVELELSLPVVLGVSEMNVFN
jgi:hypothetical protein